MHKENIIQIIYKDLNFPVFPVKMYLYEEESFPLRGIIVSSLHCTYLIIDSWKIFTFKFRKIEEAKIEFEKTLKIRGINYNKNIWYPLGPELSSIWNYLVFLLFYDKQQEKIDQPILQGKS